MEITKGKAKQSHRIIDKEGNYSTQVYTDDTIICNLGWAGHKEDDGKTTSRRDGNAELITEAFNVANETGYSPRELADRKAELLEALKAVQLEVGVLEHNWDYREVEYMPKVIKAIQKSTKQQLST